MESNFEKKLKSIKPRSLTDNEKNKMWSNISRRISSKQTAKPNMFGLPFVFLRAKYVVAILLLITFITGPMATVAFADNSKPGDLLFPLDIASENFRLKFSTNNKRDELHIRFASERLDEVRQLLALASISNEEETVATTTSTESEDLNNKAISHASDGFAVALQYLEDSKVMFAETQNESAIIAIDSFIGELTELADNYVTEIENVSVRLVGGPNNKVKIEVQASIDNVKTKFKFNGNGKGKSKAEIKSGNSKLGLNIDKDSVTFKFENKASDKTKGKGNKNIKVCHDNDTEYVSSKDLSDHLSHGDTLGKCEEEDDEDGDDYENNNNDNNNNDGKKVFVCHKGENTIHVSKNALWAHVRHGDDVGSCNGNSNNDDDNTGTTTPDTTSPAISSLTHTSAIETATISFNTDEDATSMLWYGTTSPITQDTDSNISDNTLENTHVFNLNDLTASTTYYYVVTATDESLNSSTSTESSFTTLDEEPADTTSPVISNINSVAATTSTEISWDTDEDTTNIVWYSTTTPVVTDNTTDHITLSNVATTHTVDLSNLTASTTYYFVISSTDLSDNTATSSESFFTTLSEPEDILSPVISNQSVSVATTSVDVSWDTDEDADAIVWYSESTPVVIASTTLSLSDNVFETNHSLTIDNLTASTTYYYIIGSSDQSQNESLSTEDSFTTLSE